VTFSLIWIKKWRIHLSIPYATDNRSNFTDITIFGPSFIRQLCCLRRYTCHYPSEDKWESISHAIITSQRCMRQGGLLCRCSELLPYRQYRNSTSSNIIISKLNHGTKSIYFCDILGVSIRCYHRCTAYKEHIVNVQILKSESHHRPQNCSASFLYCLVRTSRITWRKSKRQERREAEKMATMRKRESRLSE